MAKLLNYNHTFLIVFIFIVFGFQACAAVRYDPTYVPDCLATPLNAQYGGGIVMNPELNDGLTGWRMLEDGDARIFHVASEDGNKFVVVSNRNQANHSFAQTVYLEAGKMYTFSAWLQVSHGQADVAAIVKMETGREIAGWVTAQTGCWSMVKGGLVANTSGLAHLYFATNNTVVDIWADSISLQPFTKEEWTSHQHRRIRKVRRTRVILQAVDQNGEAMPNANVSLTQTRQGFPFGCAINANILTNPGYRDWFQKRGFTHTVFENELKWYSTEPIPGVEDYHIADALMQFAQSNQLHVRGHNIFWDVPDGLPRWVQGLQGNELWAAANKRIQSVVNKYQNQFIHWDVVNENIHGNFFESRLYDESASTKFYQMAKQMDPAATPFLNDYNTLECPGDGNASPYKYMQKIQLLRSQGYNGTLGIGLEGHFTAGAVNVPYIRSTLEMLSHAESPIWVTELDVSHGFSQAEDLGDVLQELYSSPAVEGLVMWSPWNPNGCYEMCLTDNNFNNLATGNAVDSFVQQLKQAGDGFDAPATTDSNGFFATSLPHGEYKVMVSHPTGQYKSVRKINVRPRKSMKPQFHRFTVVGTEN